MLKILTALKVSPDFVNVLTKFGDQPQVLEEGSTVVSCSEPLVNCVGLCETAQVTSKVLTDFRH